MAPAGPGLRRLQSISPGMQLFRRESLNDAGLNNDDPLAIHQSASPVATPLGRRKSLAAALPSSLVIPLGNSAAGGRRKSLVSVMVTADIPDGPRPALLTLLEERPPPGSPASANYAIAGGLGSAAAGLNLMPARRSSRAQFFAGPINGSSPHHRPSSLARRASRSVALPRPPSPPSQGSSPSPSPTCGRTSPTGGRMMVPERPSPSVDGIGRSGPPPGLSAPAAEVWRVAATCRDILDGGHDQPCTPRAALLRGVLDRGRLCSDVNSRIANELEMQGDAGLASELEMEGSASGAALRFLDASYARAHAEWVNTRARVAGAASAADAAPELIVSPIGGAPATSGGSALSVRDSLRRQRRLRVFAQAAVEAHLTPAEITSSRAMYETFVAAVDAAECAWRAAYRASARAREDADRGAWLARVVRDKQARAERAAEEAAALRAAIAAAEDVQRSADAARAATDFASIHGRLDGGSHAATVDAHVRRVMADAATARASQRTSNAAMAAAERAARLAAASALADTLASHGSAANTGGVSAWARPETVESRRVAGESLAARIARLAAPRDSGVAGTTRTEVTPRNDTDLGGWVAGRGTSPRDGPLFNAVRPGARPITLSAFGGHKTVPRAGAAASLRGDAPPQALPRRPRVDLRHVASRYLLPVGTPRPSTVPTASPRPADIWAIARTHHWERERVRSAQGSASMAHRRLPVRLSAVRAAWRSPRAVFWGFELSAICRARLGLHRSGKYCTSSTPSSGVSSIAGSVKSVSSPRQRRSRAGGPLRAVASESDIRPTTAAQSLPSTVARARSSARALRPTTAWRAPPPPPRVSWPVGPPSSFINLDRHRPTIAAAGLWLTAPFKKPGPPTPRQQPFGAVSLPMPPSAGRTPAGMFTPRGAGESHALWHVVTSQLAVNGGSNTGFVAFDPLVTLSPRRPPVSTTRRGSDSWSSEKARDGSPRPPGSRAPDGPAPSVPVTHSARASSAGGNRFGLPSLASVNRLAVTEAPRATTAPPRRKRPAKAAANQVHVAAGIDPENADRRRPPLLATRGPLLPK